LSATGRSYQDVHELFGRAGFDLIQTTGGMPLLGNDPGLLEDPLMRATLPARDLNRIRAWASKPPSAAQLDGIRRAVATYARIMDAGGRVATGTDAPAGVPPAISLHMNVRALVVGGLTPVQALRTVTSTAAALLRVEDDLGTLQPGRVADLIVVDGDPLTRIEDLIKVRAVMKSGILHTSEDAARLTAAPSLR
jgi:hypothetical protein